MPPDSQQLWIVRILIKTLKEIMRRNKKQKAKNGGKTEKQATLKWKIK